MLGCCMAGARRSPKPSADGPLTEEGGFPSERPESEGGGRAAPRPLPLLPPPAGGEAFRAPSGVLRRPRASARPADGEGARADPRLPHRLALPRRFPPSSRAERIGGRGPGLGGSCGLRQWQWQPGCGAGGRGGWEGLGRSSSRPSSRPRDPRPLFLRPSRKRPAGLGSSSGAGPAEQRRSRTERGGPRRREGGGGDGRGEQSREAAPFRQARLISVLRTPSGRGNGSRGAEIHLMVNRSIRQREPFPTFLTEGIPSRSRELLTE